MGHGSSLILRLPDLCSKTTGSPVLPQPQRPTGTHSEEGISHHDWRSRNNSEKEAIQNWQVRVSLGSSLFHKSREGANDIIVDLVYRRDRDKQKLRINRFSDLPPVLWSC